MLKITNVLLKVVINNSAERICQADLIFTIIILKLKGKLTNTHLFVNDLHMHLDTSRICWVLSISSISMASEIS